MLSLEQVRQGLANAGQSHVLQFWPELSEEERDTFLKELSQLDMDGLKYHCEGPERAASSWPDELDENMEPVPSEFIGSVKNSDRSALAEWENEGLMKISENRVGVLLLAGGQGTRLGVQYPKGMYNVGLPSGKTLYQIQAERILKIQELSDRKHGSKCTVPWYIMTSEFTLAPTEKFFKENNYFGLESSNIVMFEQRMVPALDSDQKIIMQDKGKLAMAPDGNGGLYQALVDNEVLEDMKKRGVEYLHVYCVDNILVKMADPVFIGFCVSKGADCGAKVVEKAYPAEPVGVVCRVRGVAQVVEYNEIREITAERRGPGGELMFSAGNICNHFFTRAFLQEVAEKYKDQLKQHIALKKVPCVDMCGNHVTPTRPNGIKLEKFVFDVFPFSRSFVVFEVLREDEFSPLKNADGAATDSPTTARNALLAQHSRWATAAGATLLDEHGNLLPPTASVSAGDNQAARCEISPLVSYFGEGLEKLLRGRTLPSPFILDEKMAKELQAQ
ncbi:UDP-N-acetylhexosamine pyrophosphorylase-like protein 1 [Sparus aurata]|uniref:UDP-N-acetylglucosamine pyrophosphorylase 1, like 1 n=2 Tax=Sparus aurata TaxID=8175 RepID=A0A671YFM0_SPAAU|nr:UDP-N-acetylhexosamine pyrophosphorylase-like protein 1 [Sparus aurata]XP_030290511.1 UDP-N-acetylhexosamine pyrophosphorylase-like protein 1 [Sparus aurata]